MVTEKTRRGVFMNDIIKIKKYSIGKIGKNEISNDTIFEWDENSDLKHSYSIKQILERWYDQFELHPNQRKKISDVYNWLKQEHSELFL